MIKYKCKHCRAVLETDDGLGMKEEQCPSCGRKNVVPPSREQRREIGKREKVEARRLKQERRKAEEETMRQKAQRTREQAEKRRREYEKALHLAKANPDQAKNWECCSDGSVCGPVPEGRVQRWLDEGKLTGNDWIRPVGNEVWIHIMDIPERFDLPAKDVPRCPKCGSTHISANKKGMDSGNACCGALLLGPLGLLCGLSDTVVVTCLNCGQHWRKG